MYVNRYHIIIITKRNKLHARRQPVAHHVIFHLAHQDFFSVEDSRCERRGTLGGVEDVGEVLRTTRPARSDDGDTNGVGDESDEFVVEPVSLTVLIDAVEED